jgi:TetR/AcrR family transcriptional repressor of nem operon
VGCNGFTYEAVCDIALPHTTPYVKWVPRTPSKPTKPARSARPVRARAKNARHAETRDDAKLHTRAALVNAALELFAEQGLDTPSLDAICDRAGFTRGAFYVHFKTREDILVAVMDQVGESFLASVFAQMPGLTSGGRRLHHAVQRFMESIAAGTYPLMATGGKGPLVRPHQLLDACARSSVVRERYRELVQLSVGAVAGLVKSDQDDGAVRGDVDPATVATMALALVIGAQTMNDLGIALDPAPLASAIEHMLAKTR